MGLIGDRTFRPVLRELASDSPEGRRAARTPAGVPVLVQGYAALALGMIGDRRDVAFLQDLIDRHPRDADDLAGCAVLGLGLGDRAEAIPYLVALIDRTSPSQTVRAVAPIALGKLDRPEAHETIPALLRALRDTSTPAQIERSIVIALGRLARMTDAAARDMLGKIIAGHRDAQCRHFARIALAEIAARDGANWSEHPSAHQTLANRLMRDLGGSSRRTERPWTALALGIALRPYRIQQPKLTALAGRALSEAMGRSRDVSEQVAIAVALGLLGARDQGKAVLGLLDEAYDPVHQGALAIALALLDCREAAPRLREMMRDGMTDWFLRRDLARALAILDQRGGLETLLDMLARSRSKYETASIALALGFLDDSRDIPSLLALLDHPRGSGMVRVMAGDVLGLLGEKTLLLWRSRILADHNYRAEIPAVTQMVEWN
jgi:HEAT repeat protein